MKDYFKALRGTSTTTTIITVKKPIFFGLFSVSKKEEVTIKDINLISHIRTITLAFIMVLIAHFFLAPILVNTCALYTIFIDIFIEVISIAISSKVFQSSEDYSVSLRFTIIISIIVEIGLQYFYGTHNYLP